MILEALPPRVDAENIAKATPKSAMRESASEQSDAPSFAAKHPMFQFNVPETPATIVDRMSQYDTFVVVGMGGSVLPLKVFVDAFELTKVHFLDSVDPVRLSKLMNLPDALYCIVSKSGETLEIQTLLSELLQAGKEEHLLIVTDPEKGFLRGWADQKKFDTLEIPSDIGGRFTNFTPFHRALLERFGISFQDCLKVAKQTCNRLQKEPKILETLFAQTFENPNAHHLVLWEYGDRWLGLAEWAQQAIAESLGKLDSKSKRHGIFPIVLKGPQDQHSVLQLLSDGPQENVFWFFYEASERGLREPAAIDEKRLSKLSQLSPAEVLQILAESTAKTFEERLSDKQTFQPVTKWKFGPRSILSDVTEAIVTLQAFVEYSADRLQINGFDQPGVERGKQIAKQLIKARLGTA